MLSACRIPKATNAHTHVVRHSLLFHHNNGCMNTAPCYVIHTLCVLLVTKCASVTTFGAKRDAMGRPQQKGGHYRQVDVQWPASLGQHCLYSNSFMQSASDLSYTHSPQETKLQTDTSTGVCNTSGWRRKTNELKKCAVLRPCIPTGLSTDIMNNGTHCHNLFPKTPCYSSP